MQVNMPVDYGIYWKLSHFTLYLYKASILSYDLRIVEGEVDPTKKLLYFLRKLERSQGFMAIQKKTNKPMNSVTTLLPPQHILLQM